ncbi:Retrovirus-related Pol polyprotein from transposon TNT 1-94 [Cardamine amara subsp. amara]|uniref:Retrovirus-related Pol polyprotein from transposon TNT 1-94 n=1 Tax=Cardamine amara subsp. amara TaxID=228776 RepID=A0ABD1C725_CARAN
MHDSKKGFTPMLHGITLSKKHRPSTQAERERMNRIPYASAVGSIMYAMLCTRPDVACALSMTSRYQSDPGSDELVVSGFTDASFQTDKDDFRSQSGYVFCLNGGAISWKSSKQSTVADSTTEAEYIAASEAAKEAVWIKKFMYELGVIPSISEPVALYCDNNGAIAQAKEPRSHQKSKHIERRYHLIRDIIDRGDMKISRVPTDENVADPLTKPLPRPKHESHAAAIGIREIKM